jgi:nucleoredoxin
MLVDFYNSCKDDLDIVFVSSDRDEKSFSDYYQKLMPFLAVMPAFNGEEARKRHMKLAETFQIKGIPTLIVLDAKTGNFM